MNHLTSIDIHVRPHDHEDVPESLRAIANPCSVVIWTSLIGNGRITSNPTFTGYDSLDEVPEELVEMFMSEALGEMARHIAHRHEFRVPDSVEFHGETTISIYEKKDES